MDTTGYIIQAILILIVIRQIRGGKLDLASLMLPIVIVAGVAAYYLRSVPTAGNDLALDITLTTAGVLLGVGCGLTTRLSRVQGTVFAKAGFAAAALWIAGMGARMAFAYSSDHGGGQAIADFSRDHSITGADAWVAAFVMMALGQAIARTVVVQVRGRYLATRTVAA